MYCLRNRSSLLAATLLTIAFTSPPMRGQSPAATITGRVIDLQTAEPIAKAAVSITGQTKTATTGDDGRFTLTNLPHSNSASPPSGMAC